MRDTAAASTKRIRRTQHDRVPDLLDERQTILDVRYDFGWCTWLMDLLHSLLEFQTILCFLDRLRRCTKQPYIMFLQETGLFQFHRDI